MSRKCLICEARITATQLGIDACRACAVFYRRARRSKRKFRCKGSRGEDCVQNGRVVDCRSCRFDRMREVFEKANLIIDVAPLAKPEKDQRTASTTEEVEENANQQKTAPIRSSSAPAVPTSRCPSAIPSTSTAPNTPLLYRIRSGYDMMSRLRKLAELSLRSNDESAHPSAIAANNYSNIPAKHGMTARTRRILQSALYDFASIAFPEFVALTGEEKWRLISGSTEFVNNLESTYRATKIYPDDEKIFISYTTFVSPDTLDYYVSDCPLTVNLEEAVKELRRNVDKNIPTCKRVCKRVDPTEEEFLAMLALSFWRTEFLSHSCDDSLSLLVTAQRTAIMQDLHSYYKNRGISDYATRIGELFCLQIDNERITSMVTEDYTLLGLIKNCQESIL